MKRNRLKGKTLSERCGRTIDLKTGEGMNLDTLFLSGRIDVDTYARYLCDFEREQRRGTGHRAIARIVDGKTYYEMSDREDYFYGGMPIADPVLHHPFDEVSEAAAARIPLSDYRKAVVREIERGCEAVWIPYSGWAGTPDTSWACVGETDSPLPKDDFEQVMDGYLSLLEDGSDK